MYNVPSGNRKKPEAMKINLTPVLDGVFILIFFLLTVNTYSSLMELSADVPVFKLSIPDNKNDKKMSLKIKFDNQKSQVFNDATGEKVFEAQGSIDVIISDLHRFLVKIKNEYPSEDKAILQVDKEVVYENVIKLMDSVRQQKVNDRVVSLFPRLMFF